MLRGEKREKKRKSRYDAKEKGKRQTESLKQWKKQEQERKSATQATEELQRLLPKEQESEAGIRALKQWVGKRTFSAPNRIPLNKKELLTTFSTKKQSAGGQNVNKRETAVRLTHLPTGITVLCTEERTQEMNRKKAVGRLQRKLFKLYEALKQVEQLPTRSTHAVPQ